MGEETRESAQKALDALVLSQAAVITLGAKRGAEEAGTGGAIRTEHSDGQARGGRGQAAPSNCGRTQRGQRNGSVAWTAPFAAARAEHHKGCGDGGDTERPAVPDGGRRRGNRLRHDPRGEDAAAGGAGGFARRRPGSGD